MRHFRSWKAGCPAHLQHRLQGQDVSASALPTVLGGYDVWPKGRMCYWWLQRVRALPLTGQGWLAGRSLDDGAWGDRHLGVDAGCPHRFKPATSCAGTCFFLPCLSGSCSSYASALVPSWLQDEEMALPVRSRQEQERVKAVDELCVTRSSQGPLSDAGGLRWVTGWRSRIRSACQLQVGCGLAKPSVSALMPTSGPAGLIPRTIAASRCTFVTGYQRWRRTHAGSWLL